MSTDDAGWRPTAAPATLEQRARMLQLARAYFASRSVLEVDTPALTRHGVTDPHIAGLQTHVAACGDTPLYLHTSPEYAMKRLLAAGAPDIYQICKVFRDHEVGRLHQPEFTMIEWYRRGATLDAIIDDTVGLIRAIGGAAELPSRRYRYRDRFIDACGIDPLIAGAAELANAAEALIDTGDLRRHIGSDRTAWLDLLLSHIVVPGLPADELSVIHHFPAPQAALARLDPADPATAERFEAFWTGVELANGYRELTDADEQRQRFAADGQRRGALGLPAIAPDHALLAALDNGLPECSGVALGFDRLVMIACGLHHIDQAVSFAFAPETSGRVI